MRLRRGRLNILEFIDQEIVRKISIVQEESRPQRLKVEAWALSQARLKGVNVPRVLDYYRDSEGREVIILERIHGEYLSGCKFQENIRYLFDVGRQMVLLRKVSINYGWIDPTSMIGSSKDWKSFLLTYVQIYGERLSRENIIKEEHLQKVLDVINSNGLELSVPYLVHRDLKLSNIIKDKNEKIWIVDWENVILGDPIYDIALFRARYGHGLFWENLILGYGLDVSLQKYALYEAIGLIGLIDFYRKFQINYKGRQRQICKLIQRLG